MLLGSMDKSIVKTYLECVNFKRQKHYLIDPLPLICGHFMCTECILKEKNEDNKVECGGCKQKKLVNLDISLDTLVVKQGVENHLNMLFASIKDRCISILNEIIPLNNDKKESIELRFQYFKEEIEIRAESLKIEIDELCKTIYDDMQVEKEKYLKKVEDLDQEMSRCEKELDISNDMKVNNEITTECLDDIQKKLDLLHKLKQDFINFDQQQFYDVSINKANLGIDLEFIGNFNYGQNKNDKIIVPSEFKRSMEICIKPFDLCVLSDNLLLISDYLSKSLCIYDKNMELKHSLQTKRFVSSAVTTNRKNRIYVSDSVSKIILMIDNSFKLLKVASKEIKLPRGLCYSNDVLYICDSEASSVHTYSEDLVYKASFQLDLVPSNIQVNCENACVRHLNQTCISIYTLSKFSLKYRYYGHNGSICSVDSKFYEFYQPLSKFYCYNSDGTICFTKKVNLSSQIEQYNSCPITYFSDKFIISSCASNSLMMFN